MPLPLPGCIGGGGCELLLFKSAHTYLPMGACMSKIALFAADVKCETLQLALPQKRPTKHHPPKTMHTPVLSDTEHCTRQKSAYTQRSHISNGTRGAIVPFLKTILFSVVLTEH